MPIAVDEPACIGPGGAIAGEAWVLLVPRPCKPRFRLCPGGGTAADFRATFLATGLGGGATSSSGLGSAACSS